MTRRATQALDAAIEAARALPSDGWLQRLVEGEPFGPVEALLQEVRGTVYARAKAQEAGYGLETELAEPDGALVSRGRRGDAGARSAAQAAAALARRLEAVIEDAPDWLDAQARARVDGAIRGLAWRRETLAAWIALLARIGGEADPEFVDWLAVERIDGREDRRRASIAAGSTRPSRSPRGDRARRRRAGHVGDAARRRGLERGRSAHRRAAFAGAGDPVRGREPVRLCRLLGGADRHRHQAGRHGGAGGRLCAADRGGAAAARSACSPRSSA